MDSSLFLEGEVKEPDYRWREAKERVKESQMAPLFDFDLQCVY